MLNECPELKKIIKDKKNSSLELRVFLPCFLDERHYFTFEFAYSNAEIIYEAGEYVAIKIPNQWFVLGIDDSGKYFCRDIGIFYNYFRLPDEQAIRHALAFKYHKREIEKSEITKDTTIRIQGDLILSIEHVFNNYYELNNYLLEYRSPLLTRYAHEVLVKNQKYKKIVELWNNYNYFLNLMEMLKIKTTPYLAYYRKQLERELKELGITYTKRKRKGVTIIDRPAFEDVVFNKFFNDYEFYQFLLDIQENIELRLGNFIRPHIVRFKGVETWSNNYLILEPQDIEIIHEEHGRDTFYIPRMSLVRFYTW